jgi:SAM-dependent methyltransferase
LSPNGVSPKLTCDPEMLCSISAPVAGSMCCCPRGGFAPGGKAYALDAVPEMLELARRNATEAGVSSVELLHGEIENIPLPDETVDIVISNCVINLSVDKARRVRLRLPCPQTRRPVRDF